jgi:NAD(P)-dependent dehydrogenase (short-subunit alcohol dehydrogenase family)
MKVDFAGRDVVVTGGTGALGAAVVRLLVESGATCYVPAHREPKKEDFSLLGDDRVKIMSGVDLADEVAVERFYSAIPALYASIQTAGGFAMAPVAETSLVDFRKMLDRNAVTCFLCCREAVKRIRASGGRGGRLVNVAARPAVTPVGGMIAYSTSKAAVASITTSLGEELAPEAIWVNAVLPSTMDTPANRTGMPKADFSKWPKVDEVAATIAFLASPQNGVTRGALVPVYGKS